MKFKKLWALCLASVMTLSLVACGGNAASTTPATTDAEETTTEVAAATEETEASDAVEGIPAYTELDLSKYTDTTASIKFIHHKTDRAEDGTMDRMVSEFNSEFPNIKVEMEAVTDYAEDALLRLSTKDWGDIMFIPAVDKVDLAEYFMPFDTLDKLSEKLNFVDSWEYE